MTTLHANPVAGSPIAALGEGPTWDPARGVVRWVDIDGGQWWEADVSAGSAGSAVIGAAGARVIASVDTTLGAAVHAERGGGLLARSRDLAYVAPGGEIAAVFHVIPDGVSSRLNDGACDPQGRYLVGSTALDDRKGQERLWRLEHDGTLTVLASDVVLSNGLAWSPDGSVMYHCDSFAHTVTAFDYGEGASAQGRGEVLVDLGDGIPDGLCVSADGDLWVAVWGQGRVVRFGPDGSEKGEVVAGVPLTTSCAFFGEALTTLVVTSARGDGGEAHAGGLFTVETDTVGMATTPWRPDAALRGRA